VNIFDSLPQEMTAEDFLPLTTHAGVRIERIVSKGQVTPEGEWYDQDWAEWVYLVEGGATLLLEGPDEEVSLGAGDWLFLAAHRRHRVIWTDAERVTIWLAVHWPEEGRA